MNKELEALGRLRNTFALLTEIYAQDVLQDATIIESAFKDYEKLKDEYDRLESIYTHFIKQYNQLMKDHSKVLKALEIIKNKEPSIMRIRLTRNSQHYNAIMSKRRELTEEEYNLIKEVLL